MLTVLTPLYNRRQLLCRIFESLDKQTCRDFQWLVIDDGSSEPSFDIFEEYKNKADFRIDYYYKSNGGKHTALNFAHPYIAGDYVLILDSDDVLTENAVETALDYWKKHEGNSELGVISFLKATPDGKPLARYPEECISDHVSFRINKGIKGDCCEVLRREALLQCPFPVYGGETFMDENHLWFGVAEKYKTLYVNKVIYTAEYMGDGLTENIRALKKKNPLGSMHSQEVALNSPCNLKTKIKRAMLYVYYGRFAGKSRREICSATRSGTVVRAVYPLGLLLKLYFK